MKKATFVTFVKDFHHFFTTYYAMDLAVEHVSFLRRRMLTLIIASMQVRMHAAMRVILEV